MDHFPCPQTGEPQFAEGRPKWYPFPLSNVSITEAPVYARTKTNDNVEPFLLSSHIIKTTEVLTRGDLSELPSGQTSELRKLK